MRAPTNSPPLTPYAPAGTNSTRPPLRAGTPTVYDTDQAPVKRTTEPFARAEVGQGAMDPPLVSDTFTHAVPSMLPKPSESALIDSEALISSSSVTSTYRLPSEVTP